MRRLFLIIEHQSRLVLEIGKYTKILRRSPLKLARQRKAKPVIGLHHRQKGRVRSHSPVL